MRQWIVSVLLITVGMFSLVLAVDPPKPAGSNLGFDRRQLSSPLASGSEIEPINAGTVKQSASETVVKKTIEALLNAYQSDDAKALADLFTTHGEYVDAKGTIFHGRKAIEEEFAVFRETPDTTIEIELNATRTIAAGVTASDCTTRFKRTSTSLAIQGHCQIVCIHEGDKWLIASLRETEATDDSVSHHAEVSQLEWMIGDWIAEGPRSHLHFSCRWDESGNYLLRDFSVQTAGSKTLTGTQRIGYDPVTRHLKIWVFDSAGGFSDGYFSRDGETWNLRTSGVTSDGRLASTTNAFTKIDNHRISSEVIDHVIGGESIHDPEKKLTLVRKPSSSRDRPRQADRRQN